MQRVHWMNGVTFALTFVSDCVTQLSIPLIESRGALLETIPEAERVRFLRARFVTPLPGGPGNVPAGTTAGVQGALLKRERRRG